MTYNLFKYRDFDSRVSINLIRIEGILLVLNSLLKRYSE